jgi:hypothetical protein
MLALDVVPLALAPEVLAVCEDVYIGLRSWVLISENDCLRLTVGARCIR